MEYNIYMISHSVQDVSEFTFAVCNMLKGKLYFGELKFWFMHVGDQSSWGSYDFDSADFEEKFQDEFDCDAVPKVSCLHLEGYNDVTMAAEMCYNIISCYRGPCAVFFDLESTVARIVSISNVLRNLMLEDGRSSENLIFCTYPQVCAEVGLDDGVVAGEVGDASVKCRLCRALGVA